MVIKMGSSFNNPAAGGERSLHLLLFFVDIEFKDSISVNSRYIINLKIPYQREFLWLVMLKVG